MKIILLKDVAKIGNRYDVKDVSDGYAQNLLIPKGLAIAATPDALKRISLEKAKDEGERKVQHELLLSNLKELDGISINITEKANEKGHLFASVHKPEIIDAIKKQARIDMSAEYIVLNKPIKEVGIHSIEVKAGDKSVKFNLDIKAK